MLLWKLWPTSGLRQRQGSFRRLPSGLGVILRWNRRDLLVSWCSSVVATTANGDFNIEELSTRTRMSGCFLLFKFESQWEIEFCKECR